MSRHLFLLKLSTVACPLGLHFPRKGVCRKGLVLSIGHWSTYNVRVALWNRYCQDALEKSRSRRPGTNAPRRGDVRLADYELSNPSLLGLFGGMG
jgi:hypothetical protein